MFSSNSFPNLSSSNYHHFQTLLSSSSGGTDNINTALFLTPNHHHDQLPSAFLPSSNPRIINDSSFVNIALPENVAASTSNRQNTSTLAGGYFGHSNFVPGKRPVKKDRHSKICTAQGLRDRRVRLSIEIAREFFDLQDMLGFDKASTTLGWLLKKSKKAIRELTQRKNSCNDGGRGKKKCSTLISECETMAKNGSEEGGSDFIGAPEKLRKSAFQIVAKASRDKARARARQRTREKMCTRIKLNDQISMTQMLMTTQLRSNNDSNHDNNNSNTDNNNNNNQSNINMEYSTLKLVEEPSSQPQPDHGHLHRHHHQVPMEDIIEESILLRRKLNFASSLTGTYQQSNLGLTSKDENRENYSLGLPQNWDINSAIAHSTFRAITNMNLSGGLQIYGKTWDARN